MKHQVDHRDKNHSFARFGQTLVVSAQAAAAVQPGKRTLDNPAKGQNGKRMGTVFDDLQGPVADLGDPLHQRPGISSIGHDQTKPRELSSNAPQHQLGSVTVLHIGGMDHHRHDQSQRVHQNVALSPGHLHACIVAPAQPPFSVVLTLWLSKMAALGVPLRPAWRRVFSRKALWICSHSQSGQCCDAEDLLRGFCRSQNRVENPASIPKRVEHVRAFDQGYLFLERLDHLRGHPNLSATADERRYLLKNERRIFDAFA